MYRFAGIKICLIALISVCGIACNTKKSQNIEDADPVMMLRLNIEHTVSEEAWARTLSMLKEQPNCCDEIWFSTGIAMPAMEVHNNHIERLQQAKQDLQALGIDYALQVQMTIGHGDSLGIPEDWVAKNWTGWTGSTGVECQYCNCPRQPDYLEYMRQMVRLYAQIEPRVMWIDDDLRYDNHKPATNGSRIGCWCDKCLSDFSAAEGKVWSREALDKAMATDKDLERRWQDFSTESLLNIARIIANEVKSISPETKMGYQKTFFTYDTLVVKRILKELHDISGQPISYRPGGSAYYDKYHPAEQIIKSMDAARFIHLIDSPDYVECWCPEVESYPRHYGSRSGQSVLIEGFAALAYGMDAVSMFVLDRGKESAELQVRSMLKPLAEGSDVLRAYAHANKGSVATGFRADVKNKQLLDFAISGIPVLPGEGVSLGTLTNEELKSINVYSQTSTVVQAKREELCLKANSPVLCMSPFIGVLMPRIKEDGMLCTLGIINCRIDTQGPIRIELNALPEDCHSAVWHQLRNKPLTLKIKRENGKAYIEIPEIGAWNAGFLEF